MKRLGGLAVLMILIVAFIGCKNSSQQPIAKVGSNVVTQEDYYKRLERALIPVQAPGSNQTTRVYAGYAVMKRLIQEQLLLEKARKEGVMPTEQEVQERVSRDMQRNPQIKESIQKQGLTVDDYAYQVRLELASFKLQTKGVTVTDKEVQDYYNQNKSDFYKPPSVSVRFLIVADPKVKAQIDEDLKRQVSFQTIEAKYSANPLTPVQYGENPDLLLDNKADPLEPNIRAALKNAKLNQVTDWLKYGNGWVKFEVLDKRPGRQLPFDEVKEQLKNRMMEERGRSKNKDLTLELAKELVSIPTEVMLPYWKELYDKELENLRKQIEAYEKQRKASAKGAATP